MSTRHNMDNRGFTLTELVVTIALIGIISMIAFPAISKLKEDNENEKYKAYEKVMENGAKLYVDSHKADIWRFNDTRTKKIDQSMLISNKLIDEYGDEKLDCSGSYVCARKVPHGVARYETVVICKYKSNNKEVYNTNSIRNKAGKSSIIC